MSLTGRPTNSSYEWPYDAGSVRFTSRRTRLISYIRFERLNGNLRPKMLNLNQKSNSGTKVQFLSSSPAAGHSQFGRSGFDFGKRQHSTAFPPIQTPGPVLTALCSFVSRVSLTGANDEEMLREKYQRDLRSYGSMAPLFYIRIIPLVLAMTLLFVLHSMLSRFNILLQR